MRTILVQSRASAKSRALAIKHLPQPHSAEWFALIKKKDPGRAHLTQQAIALAGSPKICSVCGDTQPRDYGVLKNTSPSRITLTMRLCERCVSMRTKSIGDRFIPLHPGKKCAHKTNGHSHPAAQEPSPQPPAPETDITVQS